MNSKTAEDPSAATIRPIRDQVLVRQDAIRTRTEGGLYIPDSAKEGRRDLQEDLATVISVGPKCTEVQAGDRIMFKRRPGSVLGDAGDLIDLLMLREENVIAVIEE